MTNPIYDYNHSSGCASITGGAFVPSGVWPAAYSGRYLFSDYVCGTIFLLTPTTTGGFTRTAFATGLGGSSAVSMASTTSSTATPHPFTTGEAFGGPDSFRAR